MIQVLNTFQLFCQYEPMMRARLAGDYRVLYCSQENESEILAILPDTEILISNKFTRAYRECSHRLRLLQTPGAGLDKVDFAAIPPGVRVCQSFGHGLSIAEHVIMVMLVLIRRLYHVDRNLRKGKWISPQLDPAVGLLETLCGKTVVILGTGEIGTVVAEKCLAFGMRTVGFNRTGTSAGAGFKEVWPISGLLPNISRADVLVVAVPLDASTRGLIGAGEIDAMKTGAYLVNVARGPVVDEESLFRALSQKRLAGAAIDVWYDYPPPRGKRPCPVPFPIF
jgi:phosphoglycerate dehydrogenase-like enzyme